MLARSKTIPPCRHRASIPRIVMRHATSAFDGTEKSVTSGSPRCRAARVPVSPMSKCPSVSGVAALRDAYDVERQTVNVRHCGRQRRCA